MLGTLLAAAAADEHFQPSSWFFDNAWIIPALPAASFLLILLVSKRLRIKAHWLGLGAVGAALVLAILTAGAWIGQYESEQDHHAVPATSGELVFTASEDDDHGDEAAEGESHSEPTGCDAESHDDGDADHAAGNGSVELAAGSDLFLAADEGGESEGHVKADPVVKCVSWFSTSSFFGSGTSLDFNIGTYVDGQSVMMLFVVTFISFLVHYYSTDYVHGDRRYIHYFAFLSLFTASMLFMVLSATTLQMIIGWELVGVCSFALIGHWWEDKDNSDAALKAFLTNRVGDIGLLIGVTILFFGAGQTFDIQTINTMATAGEISDGVLLAASLCLMTAVMSKSGQFILHTWLPDAMAGPTPVSALIHAATMVVAGVYMVGRLYPVFWEGLSIAGSSINALAFMGALTCVGGGALAFVQRDIKKVLAYSTVSQLGYMIMALGVGAWAAGMFHLFTHAFFKACLFLGAGSVSHACHHSFDMKADMGGLRKYMPTTFATFVIASASLAGIPPLAGFWSKDEILAGTGGFPGTDGNGNYVIILVMGLITAAMTAGYMMRTIWLTFYGDYRGHEHPHESGPRITVPLVILAVLAVVAGFLNLPSQWFGDTIGLKFEQWVEPARGVYFPTIGHATPSWQLAVIASGLAVLAAYYVYGYYRRLYEQDPKATEFTDGLASRSPMAAFGHRVLVEKYYLDHLYTGVIAGAVKGPLAHAANWINQNVIDGVVNAVGRSSAALGRFVYRYIDQGVIDGAVNLSGTSAEDSGQALRRVQSGRIRQYATLMFGAATVLAAVFIVAV